MLEHPPSDDGNLALKAKLLQSGSELLVDASLERDSLSLDVADGRRDRLALVDLDILSDTLALLVVDDGDMILRGIVLADDGALEGADGDGSDCGTDASASAARDAE